MSIDGGRSRVFHTIIDDNINCRSLKSTRVEVFPSYWLHLDVICAILIKLPVKSILRFRFVCKSWNQCISEPNFIKLQLIESRRKPSHILLMTTNDIQHDLNSKTCLYSLDEQGFIPELSIQWEGEVVPEFSPVVSKYDCDGFVLIYSQIDICLWNPSTDEALHVPDFTYNVPLMDGTTQHIGFGYDPIANLYKVVRLFYRFFSYDGEEVFDKNIGCEIFVIGTKSWRQLEDPPYGPMDDFSASAKGVIYWMTLTNYTTDPALLSFDISNETFGVIRPPSAAMKFSEDLACIQYLLNGHGDTLWFVNVDWDTNTSDIWELTDATKHTWKRIHRIRCEPLVNKYYILPKLAIRNGRCILLGNDQKLQCYDIGSKEYRTVLAIRDGEEGDCEEEYGNYIDAYDLSPSIYSETLVSLVSIKST